MDRNPYAAPQSAVTDVEPMTGDLDNISTWVQWALWAELVTIVLALVSGSLELQLLKQYEAGMFETDAAAQAAGDSSDQRQMMVGIAQIVASITTGILVLVWIYRANGGARRQGAADMQFTPGWAIGWYFIPFANLFKPYQAMKEIWKASKDPRAWSGADVPPLLGYWWFFWIIGNILGNASFRLSLRADELGSIIAANIVTLASNVCSIPLLMLFIVIVRRVSAMQRATQREYEDVRGN